VSNLSTFSLRSTPLNPGITLLEASAGTGKTFTIAGIVVKLIALNGLAIREILVVTFTEAATRELRDRIRKRLVQVSKELLENEGTDPVTTALRESGIEISIICRRLALALASFDEASISTIHGFCQKLLRDHAFEGDAPFEAEVVANTSRMFLDLAHDFWRHQLANAPALFAAIAHQHDITPEHHAELLLRLSRHPGVVVLPKADKSLAKSADAAMKAYDAVIDAWATESGRLCTLLESHKSISKNKDTGFSPARVAELRLCLDRAVGGSIPSEAVLDAIDSLTAERIDSTRLKTKAAAQDPFPHDPFFSLCSAFAAARQTWIAALRQTWLGYSQTELPKLKAARRVMTFDDMLTMVHKALSGTQRGALITAIRKNYRAALIDEFQDTDPLQYEIFNVFFATPPHHLMLIGDPKQSIYGFRGADLFTYLAARGDAERTLPPRIHSLDTNFRSAPRLVAAVNDVFGMERGCFVQPGVEFTPATADGKVARASPLRSADGATPPPLVLIDTTSEASDALADDVRTCIADDIATEIGKLIGRYRLGDELVTAADIAILVRSHREAALIEEVLREARIPAVRRTDSSVFQCLEAYELSRIIDAVIEPADERAMRAALAGSWSGCDATDIANLDIDPVALSRWLDFFFDLRERWNARGFAAMFRHFLNEQHVRRKLAEQQGGERRLTNWLQLGELVQQAEQQQRLTPTGVAEWIREQRRQERVSSEDHVQRLERDDEAVKIVTIHNSKGLEYPIVFCPSHWNGKPVKDVIFHDPDNGDRLTLDLSDAPSQKNKSMAAQELLAEEIRLFYVAVTRAVHRCYVYVAHPKDSNQSALERVLGKETSKTCQKLSQEAPDRFELRTLHDERQQLDAPALPEVRSLRARKIDRKPSGDRLIGSFSQLIAGALEESAQDHDETDARPDSRTPLPSDATPLARLPRGAATGIALHAVLEHADFTRPETLRPLVTEHFGALNLDDSLLEALTRHLESMMSHPLLPTNDTLRLKNIAPGDRLNEVEFYYPIKRFDSRALSLATTLNLGRLQFSPVDGFLRGFMDLVFRHEGRYYLLDWKSNWLGSRPSDYSRQNLDRTMQQSFYSLQSLLYALAVDRYLKQRLPEYRYDRDFGGIFYIFVRGLDDSSPEYGIHYSRPDHHLLSRLGAALIREGQLR